VHARAFRRETSRLREPRRILAIAILVLSGATLVTFLVARGELAGADAHAYWLGVRLWLAGGDPYHPGSSFLLPYVYAPWLLPFFLPWAVLPWSVAWFVWRGLSVLLFLWSMEWAYRRRPLATAIVFAIMVAPLAATVDTGNVQLLLALAIWGTQFTGPRLGGALWAIAVSMKWFPALLIVLLPPRARLWGIVGLAVAGILALATWPETLVQFDTAVNFPRPLRLDYVLLAWAAIPWLWRHEQPLWWLNRRELPRALARGRAAVRDRWHAFRRDPEAARERARRDFGMRVRAFFGVG
jgi:hypothetical protein